MNSITRSEPEPAPPSPSEATSANTVDPRYKPPSAPEPEPMWRPKPIVAALLNISAGLGHVYSGQPLLGIGAFVFIILWNFGLFAASGYVDGRALHLAIAGMVFGMQLIGLPIFAYILARRTSAAPKRWFQRWYGLVLFVLCTWIAIRPIVRMLSPWFFASYRVAGVSMKPTLYPDDRVIATVISSELRRGDVVVYVHHDGRLWIRRIVALPGDTVELRDFHALVNGHEEVPRLFPCGNTLLMPRENWPEQTRRFADYGPFTVPDGQYALFGDCRDNALDARALGFTPRAQIVKRVSWILWSTGDDGKTRFDRIGKSVE